MIVVPRLKKCGEHIDDHQSLLLQELARERKFTAIYDVEELEGALLKLDISRAAVMRDKRLVNALKRYIAQFKQGQ